MDVTYRGASTVENASSHAITGMTVGASENLLLVWVYYVEGPGSPSGVVWDAAGANEALTFIKKEREDVSTGRAIDLWRLIDPTPGSSKTITVTNSASISVRGAVYTVAGAHATTPLGTAVSAEAPNNPSPATIDVTDAAEGDVVIAALNITTASAAEGAGQTEQLADDTNFHYASTEPYVDNSTITMSWTFGSSMAWAIMAVAVKPAAEVTVGDGTGLDRGLNRGMFRHLGRVHG